jgi:hypothetical protein
MAAAAAFQDWRAGDDLPDFECPIELEPFQEQGPYQPLILPECRHSFSRMGVQKLVKEAVQKRTHLLCPICTAVQPTVRDVSKCKPNWSIINQLHKSPAKPPQRNGKVSRREHYAGPRAPAGDDGFPVPELDGDYQYNQNYQVRFEVNGGAARLTPAAVTGHHVCKDRHEVACPCQTPDTGTHCAAGVTVSCPDGGLASR